MTAVTEAAPQVGEPTGREEAWRFTPLSRLRGLHSSLNPVGVLTITTDIAAGVSFEVVPTDTLPSASGAIEFPAALARESTSASGVLTVPAGFNADAPSIIRLTGDDPTSQSVGHLVVRAEPQSRALVIIEHSGSATFSGNVELHVGDGAELSVVSLQDWAPDAVHLGRQHAVLGRDSRLCSFVVTLGGDVVRIVPTVEYSAPGGDAELLGVFMAQSGQHIEHRLLVDHTQPHCRSNVVYKGALQGESAHSVWVGDVIIRAEAVGTDTYEINRNLLLTPGARADSVPNLEIETGNVSGAGHASATGRFDDEQLFYLQSRGIDADSARRLVVRGFFADVVARIPSPELGDRIMSTIESTLSAGISPLDGEN